MCVYICIYVVYACVYKYTHRDVYLHTNEQMCRITQLKGPHENGHHD
jgi:hypothetical protein